MAAARVSNEGGDGVVRFPLSPSAALVIQKGDITKWLVDSKTDAIVSASFSLSLSLSLSLCVYNIVYVYNIWLSKSIKFSLFIMAKQIVD